MDPANKCPCKRVKCERHGNCAACKQHHHDSVKRPLTTCERMKAKQRNPIKENSMNNPPSKNTSD